MAAIRPTRYLADLVDVSVATPSSGDVLTWSASNSRWEAVAGTTTPVPVLNGGTGATTTSGARTNLGLGSLATLNSVTLTSQVTGILPVANGGTGTATPGLVEGSNIAISGTWPNQTIAATAVPTSPGGSTGQLQYNNAGSFGGVAWSAVASSGQLLTATAPSNTDKPIVLVPRGTTATITNVAVASNVVTITTSSAHGFKVGRAVTFAGCSTITALNTNKRVVRSVPSSTTFTIFLSTSNLSTTAETGTVTSSTSSVPLLELQDGSGFTFGAIRGQPEDAAVIAGQSSVATAPITGRAAYECFNNALESYGEGGSLVHPWMAYTYTTATISGAARISIRTTGGGNNYDAAAIDLAIGIGSGGEINFYTGGNTSGATLVHAAKLTSAGNLVLNKTLQVTALTQNAQIGYSNYVDTGANLHVSGNSSKAMVLQGTQFGTNNTLEVQLGGGNSVVAGITYQGNWWIGTPTTNNGTTRLIVSPRQTTDVGLMVAGIASQTGKLIALAGRSSTTDNVSMGYVDAVWTVSTHASRLADVVISTTGYGGDHEAIRFSDTSGIAQTIIPIANIRDAADDAAAAALSPAVPVGGLYRTGSTLKIRVS